MTTNLTGISPQLDYFEDSWLDLAGRARDLFS